VLDLKVNMDIDNATGFSMTVSNWDDRALSFKYSDTDTFDVGNRVHIRMGYAGALLSMVRGVITSLTPNFPESGPPTLAISGLDSLILLHDRKPGPKDQKTFSGKADWEIVEIVAARNKLKANTTREGPRHDIVVQKDQDELQFLMERARRIDYDLFIHVDPQSGKDVLNFVKPTDGRSGGTSRFYVFEWGMSLVSFSPKLTITDQVGHVTVRSWDPRTKSTISFTAGPEHLPGNSGGGLSGPQAAKNRLGGKEDLVVDRPALSGEEARDLAVALLRERSYRFLTGTVKVIGLPDLRPSDNVELKGVGQRFEGIYYVTKVEHSLGGSGYLTTLEVRKDFDGGVK
jgi:uncharacterized protein